MTDSPLVGAWLVARERAMHPMQIPGHKGQYAHDAEGAALGARLLGPLVRDDIPLQGGVDDNAFSHGYLEAAERLWSRAVDADYCRFLVGGSTQGNIAALSAVARPGQPIAIDRTSHRSSQAALVISGARPVWVYPRLHPELGLPIGIPPQELDRVREQVSALFVTSPSYVGTLSDLSGLADAAHARDLPLVVDQAWGGHLGFLPGRGALAQGADVSVTSVHKALMGYTQTAVVSMRDGRVDRSHLDRCVDLVATTSPSGTLMASIDATRAVLEEIGLDAFARTIEQVAQLRKSLASLPGLVVLDDDVIPGGVDPFKVTMWLPRTGVDGVALGQRLWDLGHGPESADRDTVVLSFSLVDRPEFFTQMDSLLRHLLTEMRGDARTPVAAAVWQVEPEAVCTPREAFFARRRRIRLDDAAGEVSAEQFCPYPPGVPLIAPGERITRDAVAALRAAARDVRVAYCSDASLETVEVVDTLLD